jgi:hypothetical protein
MRWLTSQLNEVAQQGWRLHTIFEQDKNTAIVFERPTRPGLTAAGFQQTPGGLRLRG